MRVKKIIYHALLSKADLIPESLEASELDLISVPDLVDTDLGPGLAPARPALSVPPRCRVQPVVVTYGDLLKRWNVSQRHDAHDVPKSRIMIHEND